MTDSAWNPPTGPPNGVPLRPADARREIDEAIAAAQAADRQLRADLTAATIARVRATDRLDATADEVDEAESLAKRALTRANEAARAGQRDDARKWTAAAQVFAMRMRDSRTARTELEQQVATETQRADGARAALAANIGRLEAVAAARLPVLSGRKASKAQSTVDEAVALLATPTDDLVAGAVRAAQAAADAADDDVDVVVADDDLEREVDVESTDDILAQLRTELGLEPTAADRAEAVDGSGPGDVSAESPADADAPPPDEPPAAPGSTTPGASPTHSGKRGKPGGGRSWPVPARR